MLTEQQKCWFVLKISLQSLKSRISNGYIRNKSKTNGSVGSLRGKSSEAVMHNEAALFNSYFAAVLSQKGNGEVASHGCATGGMLELWGMIDLEKGGHNLASSANVFKLKGQSRLIITLNTEGDCKTIHCKLLEFSGD